MRPTLQFVAPKGYACVVKDGRAVASIKSVKRLDGTGDAGWAGPLRPQTRSGRETSVLQIPSIP